MSVCGEKKKTHTEKEVCSSSHHQTFIFEQRQQQQKLTCAICVH